MRYASLDFIQAYRDLQDRKAVLSQSKYFGVPVPQFNWPQNYCPLPVTFTIARPLERGGFWNADLE